MKVIAMKDNYIVEEYKNVTEAEVKNNTLVIKNNDETIDKLENGSIREVHNLSEAEFSYNGTLRNRHSNMSRIEVSGNEITILYDEKSETITGEEPEIVEVKD